MSEDELELRLELAAIQLQALQGQLKLIEAKLDMTRAMYGTPQEK